MGFCLAPSDDFHKSMGYQWAQSEATLAIAYERKGPRLRSFEYRGFNDAENRQQAIQSNRIHNRDINPV